MYFQVCLALPSSLIDQGEGLSPLHKYQTLVYSANSFFHLRDIKRAEAFYKKALQYRKSLAKVKGKQVDFPRDCTSEIGKLKYSWVIGYELISNCWAPYLCYHNGAVSLFRGEADVLGM